MVLTVEFRIPIAPSADFRRMVLMHAPREGEDTCPQCGADRFHLVDALLDHDCWENRGLAASMIRGCKKCRQAVAGILVELQTGVAACGDSSVRHSDAGRMLAASATGRR